MNYHTKFTQTNDWLINAILEKMIGRLPTKDELRANLKIDFDQLTHTNTVYYNNTKIMESQLGSFDGVGISGFFSVPEELMDEFIKERIDNWNK